MDGVELKLKSLFNTKLSKNLIHMSKHIGSKLILLLADKLLELIHEEEITTR